MIIIGSQRGGGRDLNVNDNDHVTVHEVAGFTTHHLHGAFEERVCAQ